MAWIKKKDKAKRNGPNARGWVSEERKERSKVYSSAAWRKLRDLKRRNDPLCELCLKEGKIVPGEDIHHIRSFTKLEGNARIEAILDYDNLITLCKRCHQKIHHGGEREHNGD